MEQIDLTSVQRRNVHPKLLRAYILLENLHLINAALGGCLGQFFFYFAFQACDQGLNGHGS
jgi:hypothetical protein